MVPIDTPAVPIMPYLRKSLRFVVLVLIRILGPAGVGRNGSAGVRPGANAQGSAPTIASRAKRHC